MPPGEINKSLDQAREFWSFCIDRGIDRNSLCIGLGGGVVCDLLGFSASVLLRGIDAAYIPTTLMAMADASIGGKTGVNFENYKNMIGAFQSPKCIMIDVLLLKTLEERQLRNGFVEIIKHHLINPAADLQKLLQLDWNQISLNWEAWIGDSVQYKLSVVQQDYLDVGVRRNLNFGHTLGHAIESYFLELGVDILHGEAVSMGIVGELILSSRRFEWDEGLLYRIINFMKPYYYARKLEEKDIFAIINKLNGDKKRKAGNVDFILLKSPGHCVPVNDIDQPEMIEVLESIIV